MKALVYAGPKTLLMEQHSMPSEAAGEVLLRIEAAGICGSDMHAWHGRDPRRKPGLVLGHEFVGQVEHSSAPGIEVGQRFTGNPLIVCGVCDYCVQGRDNLCSNRTMVGMTRPGAFAEYMSIPASSLIPLPEQMPTRLAALTEPAATVWHAIALSMNALARPLHECRVLVIGGGAIGMLSGLLLRHLGVAGLTLSEPNASRRAELERNIDCQTIDPSNQSVPGEAFEFIIDAVGAGITRSQSFAAIRPGGVIMHIGLQDWESAIDMRKLTLAEITLLGTYTYTTADLRATVAALARGAFGDLRWVEERPLDDGQKAFEAIDRGQSAAAKILLRP